MKLSRLFTRPLPLTAAIALAGVLTGCTGGAQSFRPWYYRFSNSVTDVAATDLAVDETVVASGVAYGTSTPDFTQTTTEHQFATFDLFDAGTSNFIDSLSVDKGSDESVHVFALGVNSPGTLQPHAQLVPVKINRNIPNGNARVYVVHGYVRAVGTEPPPIDFVRSGQIQPVVSNLAFAGSQVFTLPPATYTFEIRFAGTQTGILFPTPTPVTIQAGKIYIFLIRGLEGGSGALTPTLDIFEEPPLIP